jgi:hypothetical protein
VTARADQAAVLWAERCLLRVPVLYTRGIDRRDWELVRSCFADDAYIHGTRTIAALDKYLPETRAGVEYYPVTMHFVGNQIADVGEDARSGHVETYAVAYHWCGADPGADHEANLIVGVRYQDDIVEKNGEWRIVRRSVSADWHRGDFPPLS